jgi:hypothetical protein
VQKWVVLKGRWHNVVVEKKWMLIVSTSRETVYKYLYIILEEMTTPVLGNKKELRIPK